MTETELAALCAAITPPDEAARAAAHAHWASLAKPLGGLGGLETTIEEAAALTGSAKLDISRRAVLVLCADNGVVAQGVSQTDSSVTRAVAENLAARRTSVCRMAQTARCEVVPVDMGIAGEPLPGVLDCRIAPRHSRLHPRPGHEQGAGRGGHRQGNPAGAGAEESGRRPAGYR